MIQTWGRVLLGGMSKGEHLLIHKCIFGNLNTINLKLFRNHGRMYMFTRKFKKILNRKTLGVHSNMIIVIDRMFVYYFVNPDLRVEKMFRKERTAEK